MTSLSKNGWKKNLSLQSERSFQLTIRHNLLCLMWTVHQELLLLCIQCNMICWTAEEAWDRANIKGCFLAVPLGAVSVMLVYKQMGPLVYFLFYFIFKQSKSEARQTTSSLVGCHRYATVCLNSALEQDCFVLTAFRKHGCPSAVLSVLFQWTFTCVVGFSYTPCAHTCFSPGHKLKGVSRRGMTGHMRYGC